MQAQETLSMGRAGLTSADARTLAKRGRIKARAEARTGRCPDVGRETFQMWNGKPQAGALPHGGEAAWMQAQETLSMGRAGLISADARTRAKRGRIKARAEARTGRSPDVGAGNHAAHSRHPRLVIDKALWKAA